MRERGRGPSPPKDPLHAAITTRLGQQVEVAKVVQDGTLAMVHVRLPELPLGETLSLREWVQTELRTLSAEQSDGMLLAPHYL